MTEQRLPQRGFLAARNSEAEVLAYDLSGEDAVWIRMGSTEESNKVLWEDCESIWELPESRDELNAFIKRYGFQRITAKQAEPHIKRYVQAVYHELMDPAANREIMDDPAGTIAFVRCVKNFIMDIEELLT